METNKVNFDRINPSNTINTPHYKQYKIYHAIFPKSNNLTDLESYHNNVQHSPTNFTRMLNENKNKMTPHILNRIARKGGITTINGNSHINGIESHRNYNPDHNIFFTTKNISINLHNNIQMKPKRKTIQIQHQQGISNQIHIQRQWRSKIQNAISNNTKSTQWQLPQKKRNPQQKPMINHHHQRNINVICWNVDGGLNKIQKQ